MDAATFFESSIECITKAIIWINVPALWNLFL